MRSGVYIAAMRIILFTGAGVSAESGLATFRSDQSSVWANHNLDEVCDIKTWRRNFEKVHAFYNTRRSEIASVAPNAFHEAVARWSKEHEVINITQNIDDLFERAGCENVIHLHGFCRDMICQACDHIWQIEGDWIADDPCPNCSSERDVKPGVVFFGENAPRYADLALIMKSIEDDDIIIVAGTSEQVIPISQFLYTWKGHNVKIDPKADRYDCPLIYQTLISKTATDAVADLDALFTNPS